MFINLHYGPTRFDGLLGNPYPYDHPFARLMPDEQIERIDGWIRNEINANIILVEELPFTYLRYLIRKGDLTSDQVHVYWHENDDVRELRLGAHGELLDPWPSGHFDRSLEFVLGGWGDES